MHAANWWRDVSVGKHYIEALKTMKSTRNSNIN